MYGLKFEVCVNAQLNVPGWLETGCGYEVGV